MIKEKTSDGHCGTLFIRNNKWKCRKIILPI